VPLDPQIQNAIEQARAMGARRPEETPIGAAREGYRERYRGRGIEFAGDVRATELALPTEQGTIPAWLYRPGGVAADQALPLLVYFHGGGFVLGDAESYAAQSAYLAERAQCAVLFPEFRLAPEFPFPAAVNDAIAAVRWVLANAASLSADPSRIALMGDSAGGNLAINASLALRGAANPIDFQCLLYPTVDYRHLLPNGPRYPSEIEFGERHWLDRSTREWFFRQYFAQPEDACDPRASPLLVDDLSRLPPTIVITAECDPLRDMGRAFFERLLAAGNTADYRCIEGMVHNFLGHCRISQAAERALGDVVNLVRARLHRGD
jgi:acetyl esterase